MKKNKLKYLLVIVLLSVQSAFSSSIVDLIPDNTATHTAKESGSWSDTSTWVEGTIPTAGAIVVIPAGMVVTYSENSEEHIFAIKVKGTLKIVQTSILNTTKLVVDTFVGLMGSKIYVHASAVTDGNISIVFKPFDIQQHKPNSTRIYPLKWSAVAKSHFSDKRNHYKVTYKITTPNNKDRFNDAADGNLNTSVAEHFSEAIDDGPGVYGRSAWDPDQLSLGLVTMGEIQVLGKSKTNMVKLGADASKNQTSLSLSETPVGWSVGDELVITSGGNQSTNSKGVDQVAIGVISGTAITSASNLLYNHEGRTAQSLHCYVGNLSRNITLSSADISEVSRRGHVMAMHNPTDVQFRYAAFKDLGRTDKSRVLDDFIFDKWIDPVVFTSKLSALGQECMELKAPEAKKITNSRGRYSIHLHRTGAANGTNAAYVEGNAIWGNPGWAITHHDSHAEITKNVVYDVTGAGIVSESGSETGFWDDNLVVDIKKGRNGKGTAMTTVSGENYFDPDFYHSSLFYDDYLFRGEGLAMKGRAVVCRNNIISDTNFGVGINNINPVKTNLTRVDPAALKVLRPKHMVDHFPLDTNGYSSEGDGVMPVEVALFFENTTVINSYTALNSIERDMGVNHESRSVFDGFKGWGVNIGFQLTYQTDYSFKDVFLSGKNMNSRGIDMWKHSQNHTFENTRLEDFGTGIRVSKIVGTSNNYLNVKTRNNGFTQWTFVNYSENNVTNHYALDLDSSGAAYVYNEHCDNISYLETGDIMSTREVAFTSFTDKPLLSASFQAANQDSNLQGSLEDYDDDLEVDLEVDLSAIVNASNPKNNPFRFRVNGLVSDSGGTYNFGNKQAWAQGSLRFSYPQRTYEFASKAKFEAYLVANGVYKDASRADQLYFIINEVVPDRFTFEYKSFPVKIDILNAPNTAPYSTAVYESTEALAPKTKVLSVFGTATQSLDSSETFEGVAIATPADRAIDGNTNGRKHAQFYQKGKVPVGSSSLTGAQSEPWWELDLGQNSTINHIDVWGRQTLNGKSIPVVSEADFGELYVLIKETPFTSTSLAAAKLEADKWYHRTAGTRLFSMSDINKNGRYVRIQGVGSNRKLGLAEVTVLGKKEATPDPCEVVEEDGVLLNKDFECGFDADWNLTVIGGTAEAIFTDGLTESNEGVASAKINVTIADAYNKVQLRNTVFDGDLDGKTLTVSMYAKSPSTGTSFKYQLAVVNALGVTTQHTSASMNLTSSYQKYDYAINVTEETQSVLLKINTGKIAGTYYFDNSSSTIVDTLGQKSSLDIKELIAVEEQKFEFYPNPANNTLFVKGQSLVSKISMYKMTGVQVAVFKEIGSQIDISSLSSGIYLLVIDYIDGDRKIEKLIIE